MTSQRIRVSHLSTQVAAEIARSQADSVIAREAARDRGVVQPPLRQPPAKPRPRAKLKPKPPSPVEPALPAGSVVLCREEWQAVEHLIDTQPADQELAVSGSGVSVGSLNPCSPRVQMYKGPALAAPATSVGIGGVPIPLDTPIRLPQGHLACRSCAVAMPSPHPRRSSGSRLRAGQPTFR